LAAVGGKVGWGKNLRLRRCSVTEQDRDLWDQHPVKLAPFGYATVRVEEGSGPSAPEVAVGELTDKSVTLRWKPVSGARQYNVYRGDGVDFVPDVYHLVTTTCEMCFTDDWLKAGTSYYYRVAGVDANAWQGILSEAMRGTTHVKGSSPPAKVGSAYTGLITAPRAWRGDRPDMLYLLWGQNADSDLSHYELYRSETPDFQLGEKTFLAKVAPGPYVVVPFEDQGLKPHTTYYYRVRAVDRDGHKGQPSEVCRGVTREAALGGQNIE
jgi:fibronectin type 3 domain-containing protein